MVSLVNRAPSLATSMRCIKESKGGREDGGREGGKGHHIIFVQGHVCRIITLQEYLCRIRTLHAGISVQNNNSAGIAICAG